MGYSETIARELEVRAHQVSATLRMLEEGATIPFMARYRKEATGNLDEVQLTSIRDRKEQLEKLDKRRAAIVKSLEERELLTDDLSSSLENADSMSELEDIYLPYKPKRRTRASIAKEKGLQPLADLIMAQNNYIHPQKEAASFVDSEKGVASVEEALTGARDIIAEHVNEDKKARETIRKLFKRASVVTTKLIKGKEEEGQKYRDYFNWEEPITKIPSHRMLALRRAEKELIISMSIQPEEEEATYLLEKQFIQSNNDCTPEMEMAIKDGYKRLMAPSIETETRLWAKENADEEAIKVFTDNLRQLLLAPPLGKKRILALDPGFRTGCKVVCLDEQGKLLKNDTIYPHPPQSNTAMAESTLKGLMDQYDLEVIAIGNGTASRETEAFAKSIKSDRNIPVVMVNESGASVYSASETAREEFPDYDVTVRGAVSIGRRLMDPLAELVKIDPKSIGVGQYQHDVDQTLLKKALDDTVMSCVNSIGVELNTASKELLTYVSGLGPSLAQNIITHRKEHGPFTSKKDLMKVSRLGAKAFEQAAGFLRIQDANNPLDTSAVHPESYHIVEKMAQDLSTDIIQVMQHPTLQKKIDLKRYVTDTVGLPTLNDILSELAKPGRDPREKFEFFSFDERVNTMEDLREGMILPGIVTNITDFGAFVDIGVHQDGLVHLSQMADRFVKHPGEIVKVHQQVQVKVLSIEVQRKRIALSMKQEAPASTMRITQNNPRKSKRNRS